VNKVDDDDDDAYGGKYDKSWKQYYIRI